MSSSHSVPPVSQFGHTSSSAAYVGSGLGFGGSGGDGDGSILLGGAGGSRRIRNVLTGGVIFYILSLPYMNQLTNSYLGNTDSKCPSFYTRIFHTALYMLVLVMLMTKTAFGLVPWNKVLGASALSALLFFFLTSPDMYRFTNSLLRLGADPGCPHNTSILLHAAVFMFVSHVLMCKAAL